MRVLVIGCGWLGTSLSERMLEEGLQVSGTTRNVEKLSILQQKGIKPIKFDGEITDQLKVELQEADIIVINFPPSKSLDYPGEINEILQTSNKSSKVIFTSSTGVYPEHLDVAVEGSEVLTDHVVHRAEMIVRGMKGQHATVLRLAGLIGGDRHPVKYLAGRSEVAKGKGPVNLAHRNDVIQAVLTIVNEDLWGKTYNVVYPEHPTRSEYYCGMAIKLGLERPIFKLDDGVSKRVEGELITKESSFEYRHSIFGI